MKIDTYDKDVIKTNSLYDNEFWIPANKLSGLDWNYFIAKYIDRDLHEKLLNVSVTEMKSIMTTIVDILSLIRSGYFYTASLYVQQIDTTNSEKLTEIKEWLLKTLTEADDTQE